MCFYSTCWWKIMSETNKKWKCNDIYCTYIRTLFYNPKWKIAYTCIIIYDGSPHELIWKLYEIVWNDRHFVWMRIVYAESRRICLNVRLILSQSHSYLTLRGMKYFCFVPPRQKVCSCLMNKLLSCVNSHVEETWHYETWCLTYVWLH